MSDKSAALSGGHVVNDFFNEVLEQSQVKAAIVQKYFKAWAKVMVGVAKRNPRVKRIAYFDLFAGPGRYKDGATSTPLAVLEHAISDPELRKLLVTVFNDRDADNSRTLREEIARLPGIETLKFQPTVFNEEIDEGTARRFEEMRLVPSLFFLDPWGYKGLSLKLFDSVLKDWGCDCIFFFNYNRINMGVPNPKFGDHIEDLFGEERAARLRPKLASKPPEARELIIVEELCAALQERQGTLFTLPFRFRHPELGRTSHHLIFASKNILGYTIMKDIMAKESSAEEQGVPTLEYNPQHPALQPQGLLFELSRPLDQLGALLLEEFAGKTLTARQVFERHHVGRRYVSKNYRDILKQLEQKGKITAKPPAPKRRKNTFPDDVQVTFPSRGARNG
jgi:three-Cys-motif partner protein